jgi:hypothetical protein
MWKVLLRCVFGFCASLLTHEIQAQTARSDTALFLKPDGLASSLLVKTGDSLKVINRQGFWVEVEAAPGKRGWVKVSILSFAAGAGGPTAIDTGRMGTGNIVATSSARGLSAKDLLNGAPRPEEVAKLDAFVADRPTVQNFLASGSITQLSQTIELRVPEPPSKKSVPEQSETLKVGPAGPRSEGKKGGLYDW